MTKSIIVAKTENHVIGQSGQLPWNLPRDMQHFRHTTMGHHVVMGRKTFASIQTTLKGRKLIVVTKNADYQATGCTIVHSIKEALTVAEQAGETEVFIAGGEEIYRTTLALVDKIYLTEIQVQMKGDTFFPRIDPAAWEEIRRICYPADAQNLYACAFVELIRKNPRKHHSLYI